MIEFRRGGAGLERGVVGVERGAAEMEEREKGCSNDLMTAGRKGMRQWTGETSVELINIHAREICKGSVCSKTHLAENADLIDSC